MTRGECERPSVVARCSVAAIRPAMVNGKPSLEVDEKKYLLAPFPALPAHVDRSDHSKLAICRWQEPTPVPSRCSTTVAAGIPNNPPRWPEVNTIVKKILRVYKQDAKDWERVVTVDARWPRFSNSPNCHSPSNTSTTGGARATLNASTHIRF